jgi:hypothetical protein
MKKEHRTTLFPLLAFLLTLPWNKVWGEPPWADLKPPASISFSVSMPSAAHKVEGRDEWRALDEAGSVYSAGYGYYTEPQRIADPEAFMRMMVNRLAANTQSKIAYLFFFKYQYVPACEFKLVDLANHRVGAGRYFLVNQWFYFLDLSAADKDFKPERAKKFFESFQIINPQLKDFEPGS